MHIRKVVDSPSPRKLQDGDEPVTRGGAVYARLAAMQFNLQPACCAG